MSRGCVPAKTVLHGAVFLHCTNLYRGARKAHSSNHDLTKNNDFSMT
jgi:hypothetical protein